MNSERENFLVVIGADMQSDSLGGEFLRRSTHDGDYLATFGFNLPAWDATDYLIMSAAADKVKEEIGQFADNVGLGGELHVLNTVGMMDNGGIVSYSTERFVKVMFTNLVSQFVVAKAFIPVMIRNRGRFVQLGSNAGEMGFTGMSAYCASKFGNQGLTQVMAKELAPHNVPVNVINPCAFEPTSSRMSRVQVEQFMEENSMDTQDVLNMLTSRIPMKRLATNDDLQDILKSVFSAPRFMTGQAISLSGGMVMG